MSHKDETPSTGRDAEGFKTAYLTRAVKRSNLTLSKQIAAAETFQVYTKSIKSDNQIGKIYALVFLRRLRGLLVAPYVQHKNGLEVFRVARKRLDGFPLSVVTLVRGNVKARTVDYCQ